MTDLTIKQGATWSHGWRFKYAGDFLDDTWTAAAQIRARKSKESPLLYTFNTSVDPTGAVVLAVPHTDSEAWTWRGGYFDVEVTNAEGNVRIRAVEGRVTVSAEVTDV